MAFIGTPLDTRNTFQSLAGKRFNGDGSTTAFTLDVAPSSTLDIEVFVGNVRQDPNSAYTLSGTTLTFTGAPPSGTNNIYVVHQAKAVGTIEIPATTGSEKTFTGGVVIADDSDGSNGLKIGTGDDFKIYHDGTHTYMDNNTGALFMRNNGSVIIEDLSGNNIIRGIDGAAVNLYHNGTSVLETTATGATVTTLGVINEKDLGVGIHIKTADSGASVAGDMDELVLENSTNTGLTILSATDGLGRIAFGDSGDNAIGGIDYLHNGNSMKFTTAGSERMRIESSGLVGIGVSSMGGKLHVETASNIIGIKTSCTSGSYDSTVTLFEGDRNTSNNSYSIIQGKNGGGLTFQVQDSGNVVNANNSYGSTSDERIKQNIADASSQWDDIKALKIRKYKLKKLVNRDGADNTPYHLGVIAQEITASSMNGLIEERKPEKEDVALSSDFGTVVDGTADNGAIPIKDADGNITGYEDVFTEGQKVKSIKYSVLYMKAIKALQEAMAKIESLEARVTTLEG